MAAEAAVERVTVSAYEIPTDQPESDGTLERDSTTLVLVEVAGGGETGLGLTYADASAARLIEGKLADVVRGRDALSPPLRLVGLDANEYADLLGLDPEARPEGSHQRKPDEPQLRGSNDRHDPAATST